MGVAAAAAGLSGLIIVFTMSPALLTVLKQAQEITYIGNKSPTLGAWEMCIFTFPIFYSPTK